MIIEGRKEDRDVERIRKRTYGHGCSESYKHKDRKRNICLHPLRSCIPSVKLSKRMAPPTTRYVGYNLYQDTAIMIKEDKDGMDFNRTHHRRNSYRRSKTSSSVQVATVVYAPPVAVGP